MPFDEEKYIEQLRNYLDSYSKVTDQSFAALRSLLRFRTVDKKECLLQIGHVARDMYFVCKGILISHYITREGDTHIKNFFVPGNFAASTVSLLLSEPSSFAIEVVEEGVVLAFDYRKYKQLIHNHDDLKECYIGYLEENWVIKNEKRQIAFATQTATERYRTFLEQFPTLADRVPQMHIASYLGITPTQLSRIKNNL